MIILSRDDLRELVPMSAAIDAVAQAFAQLSAGSANVPLRQHLDLADNRLALIMPAHLVESAALGVKLLTIIPQNAGGSRPVIQAVVVAFDPVDGQPLALLEGTFLTTLRTGAASGLATQLMARPESRTLALFGAGAAAFHQALAVCSVRQIERVLLVNRTLTHTEQLAHELQQAGPPISADVRIVASAQVALAEADVVCLATAATAPLFADADVRPGTHINAIGSYLPTMQELPSATVARARVVVDQRAAAWAEAGDLIIPRNERLIEETQVVAELGEVVIGQIPGRTNDAEITCFKSVGSAAQDVAVAQLAVALAQTHRRGTYIKLD